MASNIDRYPMTFVLLTENCEPYFSDQFFYNVMTGFLSEYLDDMSFITNYITGNENMIICSIEVPLKFSPAYVLNNIRRATSGFAIGNGFYNGKRHGFWHEDNYVQIGSMLDSASVEKFVLERDPLRGNRKTQYSDDLFGCFELFAEGVLRSSRFSWNFVPTSLLLEMFRVWFDEFGITRYPNLVKMMSNFTTNSFNKFLTVALQDDSRWRHTMESTNCYAKKARICRDGFTEHYIPSYTLGGGSKDIPRMSGSGIRRKSMYPLLRK